MKLTLKVHKSVIKEHKLEQDIYIIKSLSCDFIVCIWFWFLYNIIKEGKLHRFEMFKVSGSHYLIGLFRKAYNSEVGNRNLKRSCIKHIALCKRKQPPPAAKYLLRKVS